MGEDHENSVDPTNKYSLNIQYAEKPPHLPSLQDLDNGYQMVRKQKPPEWSIHPKLEVVVGAPLASLSPGPKYTYDDRFCKTAPCFYSCYKTERHWTFNSKKAYQGDGLSPSQISSVEMKHPLIPLPRRATMQGWNPRAQEKVKCTAPGQDPGNTTADAKKVVMKRSPSPLMGSRIDYIVGQTKAPIDVAPKNVWRMKASGGFFHDPYWTIAPRTNLPEGKSVAPAPNRYDQSKHLIVDGTIKRSPSWGFGVGRRRM